MSELIYKQDAIDALRHVDEYNNRSIKAIKMLPSVQPETKRAVWALHTYMPHHHYCTHCKKDSPYNKRWSYCPNCGYEMEEYV